MMKQVDADTGTRMLLLVMPVCPVVESYHPWENRIHAEGTESFRSDSAG